MRCVSRARSQVGAFRARQTSLSLAIGQRTPPLDPSHCAPFVAPQLSPFDAPVVWSFDIERFAIPARVQCCQDPTLHDFSLPRDPIRVHVHFDEHNRQIVIIENETYRVTLIADGALITLGSTCLKIGLISLSDLSASVQSLNALANILLGRRAHLPSRCPSPVDARHIANAIIANDGERAGAARRQIATVIYGEACVVDEWSHPSGRLKAMIKRDVLRGRRLVSSDWRDLAKAGTFRGQA